MSTFSRLKQRGDVADMSSVCSAVETDWSGASRIVTDPTDPTRNLRDSVHAALGQLIKARRVYYTGNKGYFLVTPDGGGSPQKLVASRLRHSLRERGGTLGSSSGSRRRSASGGRSSSRNGRQGIDQVWRTLVMTR